MFPSPTTLEHSLWKALKTWESQVVYGWNVQILFLIFVSFFAATPICRCRSYKAVRYAGDLNLGKWNFEILNAESWWIPKIPWRKRLRGDLTDLYNNLKGSYIVIWMSVSSPKPQVIEREETAPGCTRGDLDCILGTTSSLKGLTSIGTGCPGKPPFLEVFKRRGDVALRDMVSW